MAEEQEYDDLVEINLQSKDILLGKENDSSSFNQPGRDRYEKINKKFD